MTSRNPRHAARAHWHRYAKACKSLQNHICENLRNLSISANAYLRKLARVHEFRASESLRKHDLRKPKCETLRNKSETSDQQKVYLLLASPLPPPLPPAPLARARPTTAQLPQPGHPQRLQSLRLFVIPIPPKNIVSLEAQSSSPLSAPNASLSRYANQPMMKYKINYTVVSSA